MILPRPPSRDGGQPSPPHVLSLGACVLISFLCKDPRPVESESILTTSFYMNLEGDMFQSQHLISPLPCIASVIDLLVFCKIPVTVFRPRGSPDLSLAVIVPVILRNRDLLPEIFRSLALTDSDFLLTVFVQLRDAVLRSFFFPFGIVGRFCRVVTSRASKNIIQVSGRLKENFISA